jgi:hypothetical protein
VGYGRLGLNNAGMSSLAQPAEFLNRDPSLRDSGVQILDVGLAGRNQILEGLSLDYGFDLTRVYSGATKSFLSPYLLSAGADAGRHMAPEDRYGVAQGQRH